MEKITIIYCLSTDGEADRLNSIAAERGQTVVTVLTDSPATAPGKGAGWDALVRTVGRGSVGMVAVPSLTVLGGGLDDLVKLVALMVQAKVDLIAEAEGIDTTLPEGRAWMVTIASLQRYQQAMRSRKARAGQHRAKDAGVRFGRPSVPDAIIHNVRKALTDGAGIRPTARKWGVSPARVLSEKRLVTDGAAGPSTATIMQSFPVVT